MKIGTMVVVTVDHPDGSQKITKGDIGVISEIKHYLLSDTDYTVNTVDTNYTVHTATSDYVYGIDQIRWATDYECREELYRLLTMKFKKE